LVIKQGTRMLACASLRCAGIKASSQLTPGKLQAE